MIIEIRIIVRHVIMSFNCKYFKIIKRYPLRLYKAILLTKVTVRQYRKMTICSGMLCVFGGFSTSILK